MLLGDEERTCLSLERPRVSTQKLEFPVAIPIGQGFAGRVAAERSTVVIDEVAKAEIANPVLREVSPAR